MTNTKYTHLLLFLLVFFVAETVMADVEIAVRGLMKNSAVVEINGKRRVLKVGKPSPEGVTLVSATSKQAVIDVNGEQHVMEISKHQGIKFTESSTNEFRIPRGSNGHFFTTGLINNKSASFVVDTGASSVALSEVQARQLGINFINGERIEVATATTSDLAYRINLESVTIGSITVYNVDAVILPGKYPQVILLGNTFLNRVNLQVDSGVLILEAKF